MDTAAIGMTVIHDPTSDTWTWRVQTHDRSAQGRCDSSRQALSAATRAWRRLSHQ